MAGNKSKRFFCSRAFPTAFALSCLITLCLLRGDASADYLLSLLSRVLVLSVITVGAVFIFTVGAFGISLGASTLLGLSAGAAVYGATGSIALAFLTCVGVPTVACLISSMLSTLFDLPAYVTAALMLGLLGSGARVILEAHGGEIYTNLLGNNPFDTVGARLWFFLLYFALCVIIYHVTPVGKRQKALGDDRDMARLTGISRRWYVGIGFLMAGLGVGLGAFLILCSRPSITVSSVSDLGFNIIFAILLGGMSLSGGSKSRLLSSVIGSFSAIFLSEILREIFGHAPTYLGISQGIRGVILLIFMVMFARNDKKGDENAG